jgi:hypothetical protein
MWSPEKLEQARICVTFFLLKFNVAKEFSNEWDMSRQGNETKEERDKLQMTKTEGNDVIPNAR